VLLGRLIEKIRRALSIRHLIDSKHGLQIADNRVVRGMIEWDMPTMGRISHFSLSMVERSPGTNLGQEVIVSS
jgi:hypothetical protein